MNGTCHTLIHTQHEQTCFREMSGSQLWRGPRLDAIVAVAHERAAAADRVAGRLDEEAAALRARRLDAVQLRDARPRGHLLQPDVVRPAIPEPAPRPLPSPIKQLCSVLWPTS